MTGGSLQHNLLFGNIYRQLGNRLAGMGCRVFGSDAGVATISDAVRYPDAVVTCSKFDGRDLLVPDPIIVFEVVSPSSVRTDRVIKLREYQAVPSIRQYVIVEREEITITVLSRENPGDAFTAAGLSKGDTLQLPEIGIELPVDDIYEGIITAGPRDTGATA